MQEIAIVGFGFTGTMSAVNIIDLSPHPLILHIIEKRKQLCQGVAYSTQDPGHLLNVMAKRMSGFPDRPNDFIDWIAQKGLPFGPDDYVPRKYYGQYLGEVWRAAKERAGVKGIKILEYRSEAVDLDCVKDKVVLTLANGQTITCDDVILAMGVPPSKRISVQASEHYLHNLWEAELLPETFPESTMFVVIGTGLTMVDAVTTLVERGYKGRFCAISTMGKLSAVHAPKAISEWVMEKPSGSLNQIVHQVIVELKKAGDQWRGVMDALRPYTRELWSGLTWEERRRFMRHLCSRWMRHRHRMPVAYQDSIDALGVRCHLVAGQVVGVEPAILGKLVVHYRDTHDGWMKEILADYVLNCSGQEVNILQNDNPIIQKIIKSGLLKVDPLGLGFEETPEGRLLGAGADHLYVAGHLMFGSRLETVAVPELRQQCRHIAQAIIS